MTLTSQFAVKRSNAGVHLLGKNYIPEKKCGDAKWLVTGRLSVGIGLTRLTKVMVLPNGTNKLSPTGDLCERVLFRCADTERQRFVALRKCDDLLQQPLSL